MKNFGGIKTRYLLDGTNIIAQEVTNGDSLDYIYFFYDASGSPVGMNYLGYNYYYKKNLQGDIIEIWGTEDGTDNHTFRRLVEYTYDAWGNILQMNDTTDGWFKVGTANPFRYRGYYYDNESGFYYLQSRYYNPVTGRFLNADDTAYIGATDTASGYNLFSYCENDCVNNSDPSGKLSLKQLAKIVLNILVFFSETEMHFFFASIILSLLSGWIGRLKLIAKILLIATRLVSFLKSITKLIACKDRRRRIFDQINVVVTCMDVIAAILSVRAVGLIKKLLSITRLYYDAVGTISSLLGMSFSAVNMRRTLMEMYG